MALGKAKNRATKLCLLSVGCLLFVLGGVSILFAIGICVMWGVAASILPLLFTIVVVLSQFPSLLALLVLRRFCLVVHAIMELLVGAAVIAIGFFYLHFDSFTVSTTKQQDPDPCFSSEHMGHWRYLSTCNWFHQVDGFEIGVLLVVFGFFLLSCGVAVATAFYYIQKSAAADVSAADVHAVTNRVFTANNRTQQRPQQPKRATVGVLDSRPAGFVLDVTPTSSDISLIVMAEVIEIVAEVNEIGDDDSTTGQTLRASGSRTSVYLSTEKGSSESCCRSCCSNPDCSLRSNSCSSGDQLSMLSVCDTVVPPDTVTASGSKCSNKSAEMETGLESEGPPSVYATGTPPQKSCSEYCFQG